MSTQQIDIGRLTRKRPDLSTVKKPRFLFPGWEVREDKSEKPQLLPEDTVQKKEMIGKYKIVLTRPGNFGLCVKYCDTGFGTMAWNLSGHVINSDEDTTIYYGFGADVGFETICRAAEKFLLTQVSNHSHHTFIHPEYVNSFGAFEHFLNECVAAWRMLPGFQEK